MFLIPRALRIGPYPGVTASAAALVLALALLAPSAAAARDFSWFWMFYEGERQGDHSTLVVRPFYLKTGTQEKYFQSFFMPFLLWRYHDPVKDTWKWLFGIGQADNLRHADGSREFDFGFFPLLFFGFGDRPDERYGLVWPIGGVLKKKFVTDSLSAWLFPGFLLFIFFPPASLLSYTTLAYMVASMIPVYLQYRVKDFRAWSILWPLFLYGRSANRFEFRILPLFAMFRKKDWYDKYSVLMIFNYERYYYENDVHQSFFLVPLIGRKWSRSGRVSSWTLLWPLFSWGYDERTRDWQMNLFWPLVQLRSCESPKIYSRIAFPFFGIHRYNDNETFFVTPLYFRLRKKSYRFDSEQNFILGIIWYYRRDYHERPDPRYGMRWRFFKIWPLFQAEWNDRGDSYFSLLSLLPFRDREGYEKIYQPFWSIVEYERFADGEKRLGLLMRLYYQRWGPDFFALRVPFVMNLAWREKRLTEALFVFYMFGYTCGKRGQHLRLFWIPIRIGADTCGCERPAEAAAREEGGGAPSVSLLLIDRPPDGVSYTYRF